MPVKWKIPYRYLFLIQFLLVSISILNLAFWQNAIIGIVFSLLFFLISIIFSAELFFYKNTTPLKYLLGTLFPILYFSLIGTVVYFLYQLNLIAIIIIILSIYVLFIIRYKYLIIKAFEKILYISVSIPKARTIFSHIKKSQFILLILYLVFEVLLFITLYKFQIFESVASPWKVLPNWFFFIYFIASVILILLILFTKNSKLSLLCIVIHIIFNLSIPIVLYPLGYGFDPFIHQETEKIIFETGSIYPKPFYYIGQYALVVILSKFFFIPTLWVDKLLLPLEISVFLLPIVYLATRYILKTTQRIAALITLSLFTFPYTSLINTTPQGLANGLLAVFIMLNLIGLYGKTVPRWLLGFIALTIAGIHPIAGTPAILFFILNYVYQKKVRYSYFFYTLIFVLGCFVFPIMFFLNSIVLPTTSSQITFQNNIYNILPALQAFIPTLPGRFNAFLDLIYLIKLNLFISIFLIIIFGIFSLKKKIYLKNFNPYLLIFLTLLINAFLITSFIYFDGIIGYEQSIFSARLIEISLYFMLPFIISGFYFIFKKIHKKKILHAPLAIFLSIGITASLYMSYPKADKYQNDHFYNTSQNDFYAVEQIHKRAQGEKYFVLANQAVSAAALKEFSFKNFYDTKAGPLYFYPIPTSSPLYSYYLNFVNKNPQKETVKKAMDLIKSNLGFVVIPKYWSNAQDIIEEAKKDASDWWQVGNGKLYIFEYRSL